LQPKSGNTRENPTKNSATTLIYCGVSFFFFSVAYKELTFSYQKCQRRHVYGMWLREKEREERCFLEERKKERNDPSERGTFANSLQGAPCTAKRTAAPNALAGNFLFPLSQDCNFGPQILNTNDAMF